MSAPAGCRFITADFLRCQFNAFQVLSRSLSTVTTKILSIKDKFNQAYYYYNANVWPALQELITPTAIYPCNNGLCGSLYDNSINPNTAVPHAVDLLQSENVTVSTISSKPRPTAVLIEPTNNSSMWVSPTENVETLWYQIAIIVIVIVVVGLVMIIMFLKRKSLFRRCIKPEGYKSLDLPFQQLTFDDYDDEDEDSTVFDVRDTTQVPCPAQMSTTPKKRCSPILNKRANQVYAIESDGTINELKKINIHNVNKVVTGTDNLDDSVNLDGLENPKVVLVIAEVHEMSPGVSNSSSLTNVSSISNTETIDSNEEK